MIKKKKENKKVSLKYSPTYHLLRTLNVSQIGLQPPHMESNRFMDQIRREKEKRYKMKMKRKIERGKGCTM